MFSDITYVMICYITYAMLCYITCVMLCTYVMLYNMLCYVMLYITYVKCYVI